MKTNKYIETINEISAWYVLQTGKPIIAKSLEDKRIKIIYTQRLSSSLALSTVHDFSNQMLR